MDTNHFAFYFLVVGPKDTLPEDVFEVTFDEYERYLPHIYESHRQVAEEEEVEEI